MRISMHGMNLNQWRNVAMCHSLGLGPMNSCRWSASSLSGSCRWLDCQETRQRTKRCHISHSISQTETFNQSSIHLVSAPFLWCVSGDLFFFKLQTSNLNQKSVWLAWSSLFRLFLPLCTLFDCAFMTLLPERAKLPKAFITLESCHGRLNIKSNSNHNLSPGVVSSNPKPSGQSSAILWKQVMPCLLQSLGLDSERNMNHNQQNKPQFTVTVTGLLQLKRHQF